MRVAVVGDRAAYVESEGRLRFYTLEQVLELITEAYCTMDEAIYTLATEAGPRLSVIRGMKVRQRRRRPKSNRCRRLCSASE